MPNRDDFDDDFDDPSSDAFDFKPVSSEKSGSSTAIKLFIATTAIALIAGGTWFFAGSDSSTQDNVPLVRATALPTKEKPTDPGGMSVPNRDKTVYERLGSSNSEPKLERLLPRPEKPLDKPVKSIMLPDLTSDTAKEASKTAEPMVEEVKEQVAETPNEPTPALPDVPSETMAQSIAPPPPAPVAEEVSTVTAEPVDPNAPMALTKRIEPAAKADAGPSQQDMDDLTSKIAEALEEPEAVKPAPKPTAIQKKAVTQTASIKPLAKSGYVLQLLSSKNEKAVQETWAKIKSKNSDLIGTLPSNIVKADLGAEKGIYYRLRLGPVPSSDRAKKLCADLKQRKVGCFIVRVQ
jgi:hypothetical protein